MAIQYLSEYLTDRHTLVSRINLNVKISHRRYPCKLINQHACGIHKRFLGTSLLELLLVVVLISTTAAIAWTAWQHALSRQQLIEYRQILQQNLQAARVAAVQRQQSVTICLRQAAVSTSVDCQTGHSRVQPPYSNVLVFVDYNGDHQRQAQEPILQYWELPAGLGLYFNRGNWLNFTPAGTTARTGTFVICEPRYHSNGPSIKISSGGRINHAQEQTCNA